MGDEKVHVVVGEWKGVVEDVEVYRKEGKARKRRKELIKEYGRDKVEVGDCTVQVRECVIIE